MISPIYKARDRYRPVPKLAQRLFRYYHPRARGRSVLKIDGTYATYDHPPTDLIATATEYYQGGKIYTVSSTVATALTAAGYGDHIT